MQPSDITCAFDTAAGRPTRGSAHALEVAFARRVLEGRAAASRAEPCPTATLARLRGLLPRRSPLAGVLARLLHDSALDAAPARRGGGAQRNLRFAGSHDVLDIEIGVGSGAHRVLHVALENPPSRVTFVVDLLDEGSTQAVAADATGYACLRVSHALRRIRVRVLVYGQESLRTPDIELG